MSCRRSTSHETVADAHLPVVDSIAISKFVCKGGKHGVFMEFSFDRLLLSDSSAALR